MSCPPVLAFALTLVLFATDFGVAQETVLPEKSLEHHLLRIFHAHLDQRREVYEKLQSRADCEAWIAERRSFFEQQLGGFPERTPLNSRIVAERSAVGYRLESILFESRPNHHVTGNLYLPESEGRYPAVLIPCGHSHEGKAAGWYQQMAILLARNGMAALCYDPIGQGERYQALDPGNEHEHFPFLRSKLAVPHPRVRFLCTIEHTLMGQGSILLGSNIAQYRVWDGMRAIDYLQSRDDIIADKIGCTGNSGGGTLTSYLMALDDRIIAAAPGCYLTTFRRLIATKGPQDAEQNIFGQVGFGMDEPDYVMMHAPKPTLILATTRDATFDIDGAWDLFRQSKRFYTRLGFPGRVDLCEPDVPHGMYPQVREATARWMHRWLIGGDKLITAINWPSLPDPVSDEQLRELSKGDWTAEELYCTPEGQVMLMDGERSVFEINTDIERETSAARTERWNTLDDNSKRNLVKRAIGVAAGGYTAKLDRIDQPESGDGFQIHEFRLTPSGDSGIPLRAIAWVPKTKNGELSLHFPNTELPDQSNLDGTILSEVRSGTTVVFAELRGIGSTEPQHEKRNWDGGRFGACLREFFLAYLNGDSFVGMRARDVDMWSSHLAARFGVARLKLTASGQAAIPALHAAALSPDQFSKIELHRMISSWQAVVAEPESSDQLVNVVHGALTHYDLPDLVELTGKDRVTLVCPVDVRGQVITKE